MDFALTDEQEDFVDAIQRYCDHECGTQDQRERLTEGYTEHHNEQIYKEMAELGWLGLTIPEEYGGSGGTMLDACIFMEETSRALAPIGGYATTLIVAGATNRFGTEEQKQEILGGIAGGAVEAIAMTEPEAGSDVGSLSTFAESVDDGFVLNGQKVFCSNAHIADHILVVCRTTRSASKHEGLTMIWLPRETDGLEIVPIDTMGGRDTNHLYLTDVAAPASAVLGQVDQAWTQLMAGLNVERLILAATMLGIAQRVFDDLIVYVKEREQFNRPIGSFQALQHRIADMATELRGGAPDDPMGRHPHRRGSRPHAAPRGLDGEALRHRDDQACRARRDADDGRLRLRLRVRHGAPRPQRSRLDDLRRHFRDSAQHHRQDVRALRQA